jgi:hypothetical protein
MTTKWNALTLYQNYRDWCCGKDIYWKYLTLLYQVEKPHLEMEHYFLGGETSELESKWAIVCTLQHLSLPLIGIQSIVQFKSIQRVNRLKACGGYPVRKYNTTLVDLCTVRLG